MDARAGERATSIQAGEGPAPPSRLREVLSSWATVFWLVWSGFCRSIWFLFWWVGRIAAVIIVVFVLAYYVFDTKRDVAYRYEPPGSQACKTQAANPRALVAAENREQADGVVKDNAFACMLQVHEIDVAGRLGPTVSR